MAQPKDLWAGKVARLIQGGNEAAALAQIKVAPSVKDLQQLRKLLGSSLRQYPRVDEATEDMVAALSAPRLHRAP